MRRLFLFRPTSRPPLHGLQIAVPRWSPDGSRIAFIGGLMSDQGVTGGDVWVVSASGGQPNDLTPGRPTSPAWITWAGSDGLYVDEIAGGGSELVGLRIERDPAGDNLTAIAGKPVFSFPGSMGDGRMQESLSATADRSLFVFSGSSFDRPTETYAVRTREQGSEDSGGPGGLTQLTHMNDGVTAAWGKTVSLEWQSDAFHVQGWLMLPKDYDPKKKYPMIVEVHGGPASAVLGRWGGGAGGFSATAFSTMGYFVLMPNPRGSYGQGEAFTQANRKDFGYGDLRDILAGVDTVLKQYPVDSGRVSCQTISSNYVTPVITRISPSTGSANGGNSVGFSPEAALLNFHRVQFGTTPASIVYSPNQITATAPDFMRPEPLISPSMHRWCIPGCSSRSIYVYGPLRLLPASRQTSGPLAGGNTVTINGANLYRTTNVYFGKTLATNVKVVARCLYNPILKECIPLYPLHPRSQRPPRQLRRSRRRHRQSTRWYICNFSSRSIHL